MSDFYPWRVAMEDGRVAAHLESDLTVDGCICNHKWITREPFLDENTANVAGKPTRVSRGLFHGYSLPEYAIGEELLFRMRVPFGWDGYTNPTIAFISSISAGETIGDNYKFQFQWASGDVGGVIPAAITETITSEVTVADGTAFFAEILQFDLDASLLVHGQNLQGQLRRIAATAPSVSNEIIVWHWTSRWKKNKIGTDSPSGY